MPEYIKVNIPLDLYNAVKKIVNETETRENPSDVVSYVLEQFAPDYKKDVYSAEEQKEIKKRLKDLGYM